MGPGIGVGPLTPNRQATAMPKPTVRSDVHETLDVHGHFGPKGSLYFEAPLDLFPKEVDLLVVKIPGSSVRVHPAGIQDLRGSGLPDPVDIGQCDLDPFSSWQVNARNTCHQIVSTVLEIIIAFLSHSSPMVIPGAAYGEDSACK